ncbi:MAG TPA: tetratricopeptide repeat protein [Candidatus Nanopelagicales bacterium]|nr:tetratricopeptide repeat protein [Candidatus Nanopelagicales bacterium]
MIAEAPRLVPGHHLYDFDLDPGISSLGWLGPLKVRLLERITDVLLDEQPLNDPEPVLDALEDAARRRVSPMDLIDFAERLVARRASGLGLEEARTDAIAAVLAMRVDFEKGEQGAASRYVRALHAAAAGGPWSPEVHQDLLAAGLAEASAEVRPPVLEWLTRPGVLERVEQRLRTGNSPSERPPVLAAEPAEAQAHDISDLEAAAEAVLKEIRAGTDRQWPADRKKGAALALLRFAERLTDERRNQFDSTLLEREAALCATAGMLAEEASEPRVAVVALVSAAESYRLTDRLGEAAQVLERASELAHRDGDDSLLAMVFRARGNLALRMDDLAGAKEAYEEALPLYRGIGDRLGEANVLQARGDLALRMADLAGAKEAYEEALPLYRGIGARLGEANALRGVGLVRLLSGQRGPEES